MLKLLAMLNNLSSGMTALMRGRVVFIFGPETHELVLLLARNFDGDAAGSSGSVGEDEDLALDGLARFIVRVLGLHLDVTALKAETRIPHS